MWNDADIVLDAEDFIDVRFETDNGKELSAAKEPEMFDVLMVEQNQYARMTQIGKGLQSIQKADHHICRREIKK